MSQINLVEALAIYDATEWNESLDSAHADEDSKVGALLGSSPFDAINPAQLDLFEEILFEEIHGACGGDAVGDWKESKNAESVLHATSDVARTDAVAAEIETLSPSKKRSLNDAGLADGDAQNKILRKSSCASEGSEGSEASSLADRFYPSAHTSGVDRKEKSMQSDLMIKVYGTSECTAVKKQETESSAVVEPSRFCHICTKSAKASRQAVCCNIKNGTCRKVICEKCFQDHGWNFELALESTADWFCPHCAGVCPPKAQCNVYKRTNQRLRARRMVEKAENKKAVEGSYSSDKDASSTAPSTPCAPAVVPAPAPMSFNGMMPLNSSQQQTVGGVPFHMLPYLYPQLAAQIAASLFQQQSHGARHF